MTRGHSEESYQESPTACLLRHTALSTESEEGDKDIDVDLYQAGVIILAHLDRLSWPYLQPQNSTVSLNVNLLINAYYLSKC